MLDKIVSFKLKLKNKEIELTVQEAEDLYNDLNKIFGKDNNNVYPYTLPYDPYPNYNESVYQPKNPMYYVTCKTQSGSIA